MQTLLPLNLNQTSFPNNFCKFRVAFGIEFIRLNSHFPFFVMLRRMYLDANRASTFTFVSAEPVPILSRLEIISQPNDGLLPSLPERSACVMYLGLFGSPDA